MIADVNSNKTYRARLYLLKGESEQSQLLYGCIFPWEVQPANLDQVYSINLDRTFENLGTVYRLDFALKESDAKDFFLDIRRKSLGEFPSLDTSKVKEKSLLFWKFPETHQLFGDVFLEKDNGNNILREHRSWQNMVLQGSARADLLLELNKDPFFQLEEKTFQELNSFFKEEFGYDLFIEKIGELYPKGEEWKRLGNLEWIKYIGQQKENEYYLIERTSDGIIRFKLKPEISDKPFVAISFQVSNFGLIHFQGMKCLTRSIEGDTVFEFPMGNRHYCQGIYQIFEGDSYTDFRMIIEERILYIREIHIGMGLGVALPDLEVPKSAGNKFLSELGNVSNDLRKVNRRFLETHIIAKSREQDDMFTHLQKYEGLLYRERNKESISYSKFFSGDSSHKLEFGMFIKNLASDNKAQKPSKIYVMDPFANEEVVTSLMVHQSVPVHVILNSSQSRIALEEDEEPKTGTDLLHRIVAKCLEYSHTIPAGSKLIDINKKNSSANRSFHDRYVLVQYGETEISFDGYLLSSSLSSYFAGTAASLSKLNSETAGELIQYIDTLLLGYSTEKKRLKEEVDLDVQEIWPSVYEERVSIHEKTLSHKFKECLDSGVKLLEKYGIPKPIEIHEEQIGKNIQYKPKFDLTIEINLLPLSEKLEGVPNQEIFNFFGFLNILLSHTPSGFESKFEKSLFETFFLKENVKKRYREYLQNLKALEKPIGIKEDMIGYDQLPKLKQMFFVRNGLPHKWMDEMSSFYRDGGFHYDQVLIVFKGYLSNDPHFAVKLLEEQIEHSDFFNILIGRGAEIDLRKMELPARMGQVLSHSLVHEIEIGRVGEFISALIGSSCSWIHQLGIVAYCIYSTDIFNSLTNEGSRLELESSLEFPGNLSSEEKISLTFAIYKKQIEIRNAQWGHHNISEFLQNDVKNEILQMVLETSLEKKAERIMSFLFRLSIFQDSLMAYSYSECKTIL